jgi:hypothetical protein
MAAVWGSVGVRAGDLEAECVAECGRAAAQTTSA